MSSALERFKQLLSQQFSDAPKKGLTVSSTEQGGDTLSRVMQDQIRTLARKPGQNEAAAFWKERIALVSAAHLRGAAMGIVGTMAAVGLPAIEKSLAQSSYMATLTQVADTQIAGQQERQAFQDQADQARMLDPAAFAHQSLTESGLAEADSPAQMLAEALQDRLRLYQFQGEVDPRFPESLQESGGLNVRMTDGEPACFMSVSSLMLDAPHPNRVGFISTMNVYEAVMFGRQAAHCLNQAAGDISAVNLTALRSSAEKIGSALLAYHHEQNHLEMGEIAFGVGFARYWSAINSPGLANDGGDRAARISKGSWAEQSPGDLHRQGTLPELYIDDLVRDRVDLIASNASPADLRKYDQQAVRLILERASPDQLAMNIGPINLSDYEKTARAMASPALLGSVVMAARPAFQALGIEVPAERMALRHQLEVNAIRASADVDQAITESAREDIVGLPSMR